MLSFQFHVSKKERKENAVFCPVTSRAKQHCNEWSKHEHFF
jgi:hypothetical protein